MLCDNPGGKRIEPELARRTDLETFYSNLDRLRRSHGTMRTLGNSDGSLDWPGRGVYFFLDSAEPREAGFPRVVRVGTHAVSKGSGTTLWNRLMQHRGTLGGTHPGGGNHRGSVFREIVGKAILRREHLECPTWGVGHSAPRDVRDEEYPIEQRVSDYLRNLPFLWLGVDDEPGRNSDRAYLEQNSIALLSNLGSVIPIDAPSETWLGISSPRPRVRRSGLWNSNYVDRDYDSAFLGTLERYVKLHQAPSEEGHSSS